MASDLMVQGAVAPPVECCGPLARKRITDQETKATAALFKALSDPHRVRIFNLLATSDGPVCVCDLSDQIELSQPTTSFHLKKLTAAGLIEREQKGTWGYYSINRDALARLATVVESGRRRK